MTDKVDELVKLSLDRPVRIFVDPKRATAKNLIQEFVKVRERQSGGRGEDRTRAACLLALCKRTVKDKCIVFFRSKALAHQMRIVFGLSGLKAAELHGNLTQEQVSSLTTDYCNMLNNLPLPATASSSRFQGWHGRLPSRHRSCISRSRYQGCGNCYQLRHARTALGIHASNRSNSPSRSKR
jgi:hypothetical protein